MLIKSKILKGYKLHSRGGEIGKVKEFYFDDHHWKIRYLIVDTGNWLTGRQVLISPYALVAVNKEEQYITVDLTKKQIEESPSLDSDKPVSRQFEEEYHGYYGWPMYEGGSNMWGTYSYPFNGRESIQSKNKRDHHLRSTHEVSGYDIQATDGEIGHINDFIIDDETWEIRYLLIDTKNWWPGKKILLSPQWIERISLSESKVFVNNLRETIQQSPGYTEDSLQTRDYDRHNNRLGYWVDESAVKTNK